MGEGSDRGPGVGWFWPPGWFSCSRGEASSDGKRQGGDAGRGDDEAGEREKGEQALRACPMKSRRVSFVWALALLLLTLFDLVPARPEDSLPATLLSLLDGGTLNLQSLKGKVLVIRFLGSW